MISAVHGLVFENLLDDTDPNESTDTSANAETKVFTRPNLAADAAVAVTAACVDHMKDQEIAHNFLLTDGGDTLFLLPRLKNRGRGTWHGVTPGFPELGGAGVFHGRGGVLGCGRCGKRPFSLCRSLGLSLCLISATFVW